MWQSYAGPMWQSHDIPMCQPWRTHVTAMKDPWDSHAGPIYSRVICTCSSSCIDLTDILTGDGCLLLLSTPDPRLDLNHTKSRCRMLKKNIWKLKIKTITFKLLRIRFPLLVLKWRVLIRGSTMFRSGISWINNAKTGLFCEASFSCPSKINPS